MYKVNNPVTLSSGSLWSPSITAIQQANLTRFMHHTQSRWDVSIPDYAALYHWSIHQPEQFWQSIWEFCGVIAETRGERVLIHKNTMEKAKFFPEACLNFAQNLLRRRDNTVALYFFGEDRVRQTLTFSELYEAVAKLAAVFKQWGVHPGDRVASYLPNMPHTVIAMLAASSLGAIFSTCSPDFGVNGVIDRFSQITPKIFLTADGYFYGGKQFDCLERLPAILTSLPTVEHTLIVPYSCTIEEIKSLNSFSPKSVIWDEALAAHSSGDLSFPAFDFNHPLYILYSSGTTGIPKCIIHGAGGTLLQHLKEHQLHTDVKAGDRLFYFTTCGWMMWHWLVSGLANEASLILYDGSPHYPHTEVLFEMADQVKMTLFGTSAKYIASLSKLGVKPIQKYPLSTLRMITSTGSPLAPESFDYIYTAVKKDVCLASISGGTDIISCFALGNPIAPVWRGELQTCGLGMQVAVFDEEGHAIHQQKGELVCTAPFPSQPLGFWGDPGNEKYHATYFSHYENAWHHGDFAEFTEHEGLIIHGRSDAVLNPGGVRIGTAELYRQVEQIEEVMECIAVDQEWEQDTRIILFVRLKESCSLTEALIEKIKRHIRQNTTPRHVPAKIIQITDIPRTRNGKMAELAVRNVIHGLAVKNKEALVNPESLEEYRQLTEVYT